MPWDTFGQAHRDNTSCAYDQVSPFSFRLVGWLVYFWRIIKQGPGFESGSGKRETMAHEWRVSHPPPLLGAPAACSWACLTWDPLSVGCRTAGVAVCEVKRGKGRLGMQIHDWGCRPWRVHDWGCRPWRVCDAHLLLLVSKVARAHVTRTGLSGVCVA
jgi:hypothetical protein